MIPGIDVGCPGDRFAGDGWAQQMWLATVARTPRWRRSNAIHRLEIITCFLYDASKYERMLHCASDLLDFFIHACSKTQIID
jgi:hypothetical protein